jgi:hypothetical protein
MQDSGFFELDMVSCLLVLIYLLDPLEKLLVVYVTNPQSSALGHSSMFRDSHLYSSFLWMFNTLIQMIVQIFTFCEYRSERNSLGNSRCLFWAGIRCVRITDIGLKALAQHCSLLQLLRYSIGSISVCQ